MPRLRAAVAGGFGVLAIVGPIATPAHAATPPQIQLCADVSDDAPDNTEVQVAATNANAHLVETFDGVGDACKPAVEITSGEYSISASMLGSSCPPLDPMNPATCRLPRFAYFEVEREAGGVQRVECIGSTAYITPGDNGTTRITAVFKTAS